MSIQELKIEGMTCSGCVGGVTKALKAVPGVIDVRVSLAEGKAEVEAASPVDPALLMGAVEKKGYRARISQ